MGNSNSKSLRDQLDERYPRPKYPNVMIKREKGMSMQVLLWGVSTFGRGGNPMCVTFRKIGEPFKIHDNYWAVRVQSQYGGKSLLDYDPVTKQVSGLLKLRRR